MSDASSNADNTAPARGGPAVVWGPVAALVVTVLSLLGAQFLAVFVVALAHNGSAQDVWLASTVGQFYFVLLNCTFLPGIIWAFLRSRRAKLSDLGFSRKPLWSDPGFASLGYVVYFASFFVLSIVASMVTQINLGQKQELGFDYLFSSADKLMALVSLVVLPPIIEETIFRGFLFTGLRKKLKFLWAALITSVMFASLHLLGSSQGLLWIAGLDTFILSLVLCYLREKTGALWAPIALHAFKNLIAFTILFANVVVR